MNNLLKDINRIKSQKLISEVNLLINLLHFFKKHKIRLNKQALNIFREIIVDF